jgi:hypothetical protein
MARHSAGSWRSSVHLCHPRCPSEGPHRTLSWVHCQPPYRNSYAGAHRYCLHVVAHPRHHSANGPLGASAYARNWQSQAPPYVARCKVRQCHHFSIAHPDTIPVFERPFFRVNRRTRRCAVNGRTVRLGMSLLLLQVALGDSTDVGRLTSMYLTILTLCSLAGPPISGAVYHATVVYSVVEDICR